MIVSHFDRLRSIIHSCVLEEQVQTAENMVRNFRAVHDTRKGDALTDVLNYYVKEQRAFIEALKPIEQ